MFSALSSSSLLHAVSARLANTAQTRYAFDGALGVVLLVPLMSRTDLHLSRSFRPVSSADDRLPSESYPRVHQSKIPGPARAHRLDSRHGAAAAGLRGVDRVVRHSLLHRVPAVEVPSALRISADGRRPKHLHLNVKTSTMDTIETAKRWTSGNETRPQRNIAGNPASIVHLPEVKNVHNLIAGKKCGPQYKWRMTCTT